MISAVSPMQLYQEPCLRDIDHLVLPRKGFSQRDCNNDDKRPRGVLELERLRSQTQNKLLDYWKEIEVLHNLVDEKKSQANKIKEKLSKAEDREADISFRLAELETRLSAIRNFRGSLRSSIYKRRSMQFVNGKTIEPLPEKNSQSVETKSKPSRRKSTDPNFELKISSRDRTLEALEHTLMDSFRHLAELQR